MSLSRQLQLIISALFALVFAGTLVISVSNMREYLEAQLANHAQDAATSLGLSLQPHFAEGDTATMETMVNAIFDSGYYREIIIVRADGSTMLERFNPEGAKGVPAWFVGLIPLEKTVGKRRARKN